jgi:hypothetical protein
MRWRSCQAQAGTGGGAGGDGVTSSSTRTEGRLGTSGHDFQQLFDDILDANFRGAYFTVQKALPLINWMSLKNPRGYWTPPHRAADRRRTTAHS